MSARPALARPQATRSPRAPRRGGHVRPAAGRARVASGLARVAAVLALTAASLALAAPANATTIAEGILARPFTFTPLAETLELVDGADQALRLRTTATVLLGPDSPLLQSYPGPDTTADPRSVQILPDGHLLVTDRERQVVAEITSGGAVVWTYAHEDDTALVRPFSARRFTIDGRELTLIADRWAARVFAVDMSKRLVWQYGTTDEPGLDVDQLADPFFAAYRDGRVLIADNNGGNRVLEVRYGDYVEGAPDHGFTTASIVWQYGVSGEYGSAPGLLQKPRSPQRLDNGNVLVCDADGQRVIEVRASDYDPARTEPRVHSRQHRLAVRRHRRARLGRPPPLGPDVRRAPRHRDHPDRRHQQRPRPRGRPGAARSCGAGTCAPSDAPTRPRRPTPPSRGRRHSGSAAHS